MVVSTQEQKEELIQKLQEYECIIPAIEVIPAGGIEYLRYPVNGRKPYSMLSVSRLDKRKKIEWIIKSVIKAHQVNQNISIDIFGKEYGDGSYTRFLEDIISANDAQSYVRFMGWADVTEIYKNYEVFIATSLWETLGLTVMEAVGSGTAVIGLDVKYGNHLFIRPGKNGYLIGYDPKYIDNDDHKLSDTIAERIVDVFADDERLKRFHWNSYEIARGFSTQIIAEKWKRLLMSSSLGGIKNDL